MFRLRLPILLIAATCIAPAGAGVYTWTAAVALVHYSACAPPDRDAALVKI